MADSPLRIYIAINADTASAPSENAWRSLFIQARTKPLAHAVVLASRAAQNTPTHDKRSLSVTYLRRWTLLGFEVDRDDVDNITVVVNAQAIIRGVTGTVKQKFLGVLQAEFRESAVDLGYTQAQADKLTMYWAGFGDRDNAISEAVAYLVANATTWYA